MIFITCRNRNGAGGNPIIVGDPYTKIEGNIAGTLSVSDSPFLVIDDIKVLSSDTLIIDPDVTLYFEEGKRFVVEGMLISNGEINRQIIFRTYDESFWLGMTIRNSSKTSQLSYSIIQQVIQEINSNNVDGAIAIQNAKAVIQNCVFRYNSTQSGGAYIKNSTVELNNNIFIDNEADYFGGAILLDFSTASITNNTIYNNTSYNFGGGIVLSNPQITEIQNNIFYSNFSFTGDTRIAMTSGDSSNVYEQYNFLAFNNMNPLFKSTSDLHLSDNSPCINSGNPDSIYNDHDGSRNDQGAYGGPAGNW
ncbi:right-handed parallel beta-helix repeat-containing protein [Bacteroidota bacterium]